MINVHPTSYSGYLKAKDKDAEHSLFMCLALKRAGVPTESYIYATGDQDFGVRQNEKLPASWPQLCETWLRSQGLFTPIARE